MRRANGGGKGEGRGQKDGSVPGTHRSLLQTGGRKEARFSSTQVFTLTGRAMAAREPNLEPRAPRGCRRGSAPPSGPLAALFLGVPGVKGRDTLPPPRLATAQCLGSGPLVAPLGLWSRPRAAPRASPGYLCPASSRRLPGGGSGARGGGVPASRRVGGSTHCTC